MRKIAIAFFICVIGLRVTDSHTQAVTPTTQIHSTGSLRSFCLSGKPYLYYQGRWWQEWDGNPVPNATKESAQ